MKNVERETTVIALGQSDYTKNRMLFKTNGSKSD